MASLQHRVSGGHKYWSIVESRRVNGKPRPVPILYLGKADDILKRFQKGVFQQLKCKSYSHGAVAALLRIIDDLDIIAIINKHIPQNKKGSKQIRDGLTVGGSLALRAIERVCHPCSNSEFHTWAKSTSLEYLLRISCARMDSRHFWDQMNELPISAISKIESEIVKRVVEHEGISLDTLLLDATNFFTFIDTTNDRCTLAQRGKNKKGRGDLRQIGILLVVSRTDIIPLFHETYEGNKPDSKIFAETIGKIADRLCELTTDLEDLTLVFDRGNNSKPNLSKETLKLHYVGALSPSHHPILMKEAVGCLDQKSEKQVDNWADVACFRVQQELWGEDRTLLVYRSKDLYEGQLRGIEKSVKKTCDALAALNKSLSNSRCKKRTRKAVIESITDIVKGQFVKDIITWQLPRKHKHYRVEYGLDETAFADLKRNRLGYRILMTDRHKWSDKEIIAAYHGQSKVEYAFKNLENPYHGSAHPQFHWTDQKIRVHVLTCILGFLLESIIYRRAQKKGYGQTNYDNLFDRLDRIRLAALIEDKGKGKKLNVRYTIEEIEAEDEMLLDALDIKNIHTQRLQPKGLGVYT